MSFETRGTKENPYHLSFGMVILKKDKSVKVALIRDGNENGKKRLKAWHLPSETTWTTESIQDAVTRGAMEEAGLLVELIQFTGGRITRFWRGKKRVEKTVPYWVLKATGETTKSPAHDEKKYIVRWFRLKTAIQLLRRGKNDEAKILKRVLGVELPDYPD